jgi:major membrane immunogen (membrane-anchored lipoprotein)
MIKKNVFVLIALLFLAFTLSVIYKDGIYHGSSRSIYTAEPYYGQVAITVKNGKFTHVDFFVRDSAKHEYFDGTYEKYFAGNDEYINQCRNDWKGVQSYPDSLLKYQDINKVDAISGATWSYNLFKASVNEALILAEKLK